MTTKNTTARTATRRTTTSRTKKAALLATVPFLAAGLVAGLGTTPALADTSTHGAPAPASVDTQRYGQELPTEPPAGHDTDRLQWYDSSPTLRGTAGAAIEGQSDYVVTYDDDGVTGMIKNYSADDVLVSSRLSKTKLTAKAILKPGDQMPYKLYGTGQLEFAKLRGDSVVPGTTTTLWIKDPFVGRPSTKFTPPGHSSPVNVREGWREGNSHHEIWGATKLWVKRENDGWTIPSSDKYRSLYGNPNTSGTTDWAIFTIHIDGL